MTLREPLSRALLAEQLKKLLAAFPTRLASQNPEFLAETYKGGLRGIDGEQLRRAVDMAIQTEQYFPRISKLRELAHEWTKRNRLDIATTHKAEWHTCGICGATVESIEITRPRLYQDDAGRRGFAVTKPTVFGGRTLAVGALIPQHELLAALQAGVHVETETVTSQRYTMNHKPGPHHVYVAKEESA